MGEDADALHVVVELLGGQRADHRRDLAQRTVAVLFGEMDFDVELHFARHRRGVEQQLVRRHDPAERRLTMAAKRSAQATSHGYGRRASRW